MVERIDHRRRQYMVVLAALFVSVLLASCSSGSKPGGGGTHTSSGTSPSGNSQPTSSSASTAAPSGTTVDIKNFMFKPMTLSVAVGSKVTWKFEDAANHTVVADDKSFSSPSMSNGQTYSFTFSKAGTYKYVCSIHPFMHGSIVVK